MLSAVQLTEESYFDALRRREFARLDRHGLAYADYTGSALYAASQVRAHHELLQNGVFGNPHSEHRPSRVSTETIEEARAMVLKFLDADPELYDVCFTANTTAAIKLVAEGYRFDEHPHFVLPVDNHNSINGIREFARRAGAEVHDIALDDDMRLAGVTTALDACGTGGGLFALAAQSNFSGVRHPLSLVHDAKARGLDVLLDIASFIPSHSLSLRECPADFAALSFYKLFGNPTGLGALVARHDALGRLRRPWFAGGTVMYASVLAGTHRLRGGHEGFEDGTPDFLGIAALPAGFALLEDAGMVRIEEHVSRLTSHFLQHVNALRHGNGNQVVRVYGPKGMEGRGGAVALNVCDDDGAVVPYATVESRAKAAGVSLRGGCFCNPGAAEAALKLDAAHVRSCLTALGETFSVDRFASCLGIPVGAVRVSLGMANNEQDVRRVVDVLASFQKRS